MADDQPTGKPVVKRVVKKKVAPATPRPTAPRPTVRYGRPVSDGAERQPADGRTTKLRAAAPSTDQSKTKPKGPRKVSLPRPQLRKPSTPSLADVRQKAGSFGTRFVGAFRRLIALVSDAFWFVVDTVRSWRLPRLEPVPASLATGTLVGLLSVALGRGALELFEWLRGVASGGGTWGSLTFVVVAFVAFVVGELLLSGFGVKSPRLTSFLGVAITIVLILAVFLEESDSRMAIVVIPAVAATAFTIGHWLMAAADVGAESEE